MPCIYCGLRLAYGQLPQSSRCAVSTHHCSPEIICMPKWWVGLSSRDFLRGSHPLINIFKKDYSKKILGPFCWHCRKKGINEVRASCYNRTISYKQIRRWVSGTKVYLGSYHLQDQACYLWHTLHGLIWCKLCLFLLLLRSMAKLVHYTKFYSLKGNK